MRQSVPGRSRAQRSTRHHLLIKPLRNKCRRLWRAALTASEGPGCCGLKEADHKPWTYDLQQASVRTGNGYDIAGVNVHTLAFHVRCRWCGGPMQLFRAIKSQQRLGFKIPIPMSAASIAVPRTSKPIIIENKAMRTHKITCCAAAMHSFSQGPQSIFAAWVVRVGMWMRHTLTPAA